LGFKLKHEEALSNFASNFNVRRYNAVVCYGGVTRVGVALRPAVRVERGWGVREAGSYTRPLLSST
jgi:hypothetical protein